MKAVNTAGNKQWSDSVWTTGTNLNKMKVEAWRVLLKNQQLSSELHDVSRKCLIISSCSSFFPCSPSWEEEHQYGTISKNRDRRYINNLPPLSGKSEDVPGFSALFTWGEVTLSLKGKWTLILPVLPGRRENGSRMWNNMSTFLFQSYRTKSGVRKWEKGKWRQPSKGVIFRAQRCNNTLYV